MMRNTDKNGAKIIYAYAQREEHSTQTNRSECASKEIAECVLFQVLPFIVSFSV